MELNYEHLILDERWCDYHMRNAMSAARGSKDPSTKCGCIIVRPNKSQASAGFNGFPSNIEDREEWLNDRDIKYRYIIHAEQNAFNNCLDHATIGYSLFTWPFMPCPECAKVIVSKNISVVYSPITPDEKQDRWSKKFEKSLDIFDKSGTLLILLKQNGNGLWTIYNKLLPTFQAQPTSKNFATL